MNRNMDDRPKKKHAMYKKHAISKKSAALLQFIYCLPCIVYIAVVILITRVRMCENLTYNEFWS